MLAEFQTFLDVKRLPEDDEASAEPRNLILLDDFQKYIYIEVVVASGRQAFLVRF